MRQPTIRCCGEIRGSCGHNHRTVRGAWKCLQRDQAGCRAQGGYSDRELVAHGAWGTIQVDVRNDGMLRWTVKEIARYFSREAE
jgi:hypothetical protein